MGILIFLILRFLSWTEIMSVPWLFLAQAPSRAGFILTYTLHSSVTCHFVYMPVNIMFKKKKDIIFIEQSPTAFPKCLCPLLSGTRTIVWCRMQEREGRGVFFVAFALAADSFPFSCFRLKAAEIFCGCSNR